MIILRLALTVHFLDARADVESARVRPLISLGQYCAT